MVSTWSDYQDMIEWNRSFGMKPNLDPLQLAEDDLHHLFSLMQSGLCDMEIATMTMIHPFIIGKLRVGSMYQEIGSQYDYPIAFTTEMMVGRIKELVDEGCDPVNIVAKTGVDKNTAITIYNRCRQR